MRQPGNHVRQLQRLGLVQSSFGLFHPVRRWLDRFLSVSSVCSPDVTSTRSGQDRTSSPARAVFEDDAQTVAQQLTNQGPPRASPLSSLQPARVQVPQRFVALDTLRGIAALVVALGHFGTLRGVTYYLAVDFFLILSGFVLSHAYFWRPTLGLRRFLWLRWARMYPLHVLTMLFIIAVLAWRNQPLPWDAIVVHALFVQNLGLGPDRSVLNSPAWSISVEFWINAGVFAFLLAFGSWFARTRKAGSVRAGAARTDATLTRSAVWVLLTAGMSALLITAVFMGHLQADIADYKGILNAGLVRCAGTFSLGIAAYYLYRVHLAGDAQSGQGVGVAADTPLTRCCRVLQRAPAQLLLTVLFLLALLFPWPNTRLDFLALPIFFLLMLSLGSQHGAVARILGRGAWLGDLSFPIYLVHFPVLVVIANPYVLPHGIPPATETAWFVFLVLAVAIVVHYGFEKPVYQMLKRR